MSFQNIYFLFLLCSAAQAIDPFEGDIPRYKCLKGKTLEGCNSTLLEAYNKSGLPEQEKPDQNSNSADTYFMLFTRKNKDNPEYLDTCGGSLPKNTNFNPQKPVIIVIHGYMENVCQAAWQREFKTQLMCRDDFNVILVDYGWGNEIDYERSLINAIVVGKQCAFLISNIMKQTGITAWRFYIMGHSLGGQVAGIAGYYVFLLTGQKIRRITGMDPAGPGFMNVSTDFRLDKSDAHRVDVIQTNAGYCLPDLGFPKNCGHADFYPNGGSVQKSCQSYTIDSFLKKDIFYGILSLVPTLCFHKQSVQYFKVSINPCKCQFLGVRCSSYEDYKSGKCKCGPNGENCTIMGFDWEQNYTQNSNGVFYLNTTMRCPFCDNKDKPPGVTADKTHCFENCNP